MKNLNRQNWKNIGNTLFLLAVFAATLFSVFHGEDLRQVFTCLEQANDLFLIPSLACVILFIMGDAVAICYLLRSLGTRVSFRHCCTYSFIGFFYSCITPSASGGQPMQVVAMRRDRIPVAVSSVVLAMVTITYKLVLVLIGAGVMLLKPPSIMFYLEPVMGLVRLGMALNVAFIGLLLLLVFDPKAVYRLGLASFSLVGRIRPFRHPEKQRARLDRIVGQYQGTADYYRTHHGVMLKVFLITFLQRCILFLVTWFTYRAFRLRGHSMPQIATLQAMISVAADMLPLPGGMGISENMFLDIFLPIFGEDFVLPGMMLSRGISYYTQLLLSAVMTAATAILSKKRQ